MTTTIIITLCILLLIAYAFDISASITKIPSVILLLLVGWLVKQATNYFEITVPNLAPLLPILSTIGLILIVLEGSLELDFNRNKLPFIGKTAVIAFIPMIAFSFLLAFAFHYFGNINFKIALANAIPLSIISSAIAIPSAQNLVAEKKEFITYESSLSDIFGVIFFNFITLNDNIGTESVGHFLLELILMLIITFIATLALAFLLGKIKHHIKFIPLIVMIILIYASAKVFHLPALIFILLFGLFLGNIDQLKSKKIIEYLRPDILTKEVHKFKELITEIAFSIRALFFLLFGYLIETNELLNSATFIWTIGICAGIYLIRLALLALFSLPAKPLTYIAPRGLITILLFLSIPATQTIELANNSLIIQVIVVTALVMMTGLMTNKKLE
jgi:potassium/hydrogen antiporter